MDALELWNATFWLLFATLVIVTLRRRPVFDADNATPADLTRQIEFRWPAAGSSMLIVLYISFQIAITRADALDTVLLGLIIVYHGALFLRELWRIARLSRQRRQLVLAAADAELSSDDADE